MGACWDWTGDWRLQTGERDERSLPFAHAALAAARPSSLTATGRRTPAAGRRRAKFSRDKSKRAWPQHPQHRRRLSAVAPGRQPGTIGQRHALSVVGGVESPTVAEEAAGMRGSDEQATTTAAKEHGSRRNK